MKTAILLVCLILLSPALAPAGEECCYRGPGKCNDISFVHDKIICENSARTIVLNYACKDVLECQQEYKDYLDKEKEKAANTPRPTTPPSTQPGTQPGTQPSVQPRF